LFQDGQFQPPFSRGLYKGLLDVRTGSSEVRHDEQNYALAH
jgi:hypothetical protein